jgi:hypothetical protein
VFALDSLLAENAFTLRLTADEAAEVLLALNRLAVRVDRVADRLGCGVDPQRPADVSER